MVLTDLDMPKLTGFGLIGRIRASADARIRELPVVVISGNEEPGSKERAREAGATDFISKSAEATEVLSRLHNVLRLVATSKELQSTKQALDESSTHDSLTGTFTAHYLMTEGRKHYAHARRHGGQLSVMALRIDSYADVVRAARPEPQAGARAERAAAPAEGDRARPASTGESRCRAPGRRRETGAQAPSAHRQKVTLSDGDVSRVPPALDRAPRSVLGRASRADPLAPAPPAGARLFAAAVRALARLRPDQSVPQPARPASRGARRTAGAGLDLHRGRRDAQLLLPRAARGGEPRFSDDALARREARRARDRLPAQHAGGGVRDPRLRAHRGDPPGRIRRICRGQPRRAHRRRQAGADGDRGCRQPHGQGGALQAAGRRSHQPVEASAAEGADLQPRPRPGHADGQGPRRRLQRSPPPPPP